MRREHRDRLTRREWEAITSSRPGVRRVIRNDTPCEARYPMQGPAPRPGGPRADLVRVLAALEKGGKPRCRSAMCEVDLIKPHIESEYPGEHKSGETGHFGAWAPGQFRARFRGRFLARFTHLRGRPFSEVRILLHSPGPMRHAPPTGVGRIFLIIPVGVALLPLRPEGLQGSSSRFSGATPIAVFAPRTRSG
jgi:hypothetical protein